MDAGDLATWVGSTFAAIAAGATLWTLKSQRDQIGEQRTFIGEQRAFMAEQSATLALEREELRAVAEDRKWAQARQVQMHQRMAGGQADGMGGLTGGPDHWIVTVTNSSDAPVHALEVRFGTAYLADEVYEWPLHAHPSDRAVRVEDRLAHPVHLLGPGRAARFISQRWTATTAHNSRPSVTFADDSGIRWTLDSHGKLAEAPADNGS
ncbi:hypothetical protein AB9Q10_41940 [Streptomyces krungchingensis]|uniref:hypothetical protein n=1 Tax=Streptomyces krungchingensis TaxID=1565034 RepID=UPI003CE829EA